MDTLNSDIYGGLSDRNSNITNAWYDSLSETLLSLFLLGFALSIVVAYVLRVDFQLLLTERKVEDNAKEAR